MIKNLGRAIWRQSRDISVWNYPQHTVFEIFTNQGTLMICQEKTSSEVLWTKMGVKESVVSLSDGRGERSPQHDKQTQSPER
jgi:hypothetical protein